MSTLLQRCVRNTCLPAIFFPSAKISYKPHWFLVRLINIHLQEHPVSSLRSTWLQARAWHGIFSADIRQTSETRNLYNGKRFSAWHINKLFSITSPINRLLLHPDLSEWLPNLMKQKTDGDEAPKDFKEMTGMWGRRLRNNSKEKVKDQKDDVKSENEVSEAKLSSSFSNFGFNHLSDPLVFPELWSGAWSTCWLSQ